MTTREVEVHGHQDKELSDVRQCIRVGECNNKETGQYFPVRGELCTKGKVVLRGTRIVIHRSLRHRVLSIAHVGHVAIVATLLRLRTKVWWPEINKRAVNDEELRDRDWENKTKAKIYANTSRGAQPCDLQVGDQVLLKQKKSKKLSTNFH